MANTTWSPTDKSSLVALTGSNLIATTATGTNVSGRAALGQLSGKFYWEVTPTIINGFNNTAVGVANGTTPINSFATGAFPPYAGGCVLDRSGDLCSNNTLITGGGGAISVGVAAGIALDMVNLRCWIRASPGGTWNGDPGANPVTNVNGVNISAYINSSAAGFPVYSLGEAGNSLTANFGDTAFSGTVPSGFTAGFPASTGGAQAYVMVMA